MDRFHTLYSRSDLPDTMPDGVDTFEFCRLAVRHPYRPEVVDCEIHLEYIKYPEKQTIKRLIFKVTADEVLANWCANHPTYKKGSFPLVVFLLHDWCLKKKFVEVEGKLKVEGGTQDIHSGGKMFFSIDCMDTEEGLWLVPLADIARTHLFDRLKVFYRENPQAIPNATRRLEVMVEEQNRLLRKKREKTRIQKMDRRKVQRPREQHTLFVDESGDVGFKDFGVSYIFSGVLIPNARIAEADDGLRRILAENWKGGGAPKELHANGIPESKRATVKQGMATLFEQMNLTAISFVIQKKHFGYYLLRRNIEARALRTDEEDPFNVRWNHLFTDDKYFVKANTLAASVEMLVMQLFDDFFFGGKHIAIIHDKKRNHWMNTALRIGFRRGVEAAKAESRDRFGETLEPGLSFDMAHSETAPGLWLADWISNEVHGWAHHEDFSPAFKAIQNRCKFIGFQLNTRCVTNPVSFSEARAAAVGRTLALYVSIHTQLVVMTNSP